MQNSHIHQNQFSLYKDILSKQKIAIITTNFNSNITHILAKDTKNHLINNHILSYNIEILQVSGALELPFTLQYLAKKNIYGVLIAIGAIIRGDTYHFEIVCNQSASGIQTVSLEYNIPIINGVITVNNLQQAIVRLNKSQEFANTAIHMLLLSQGIYYGL